jgi:hypothetical protein
MCVSGLAELKGRYEWECITKDSIIYRLTDR